jgi:hypothetical protein
MRRILALITIAAMLVCTAAWSDIYKPGDTHICNVSWADTLGEWYPADMDSVVIRVYAPPGSLWQHGHMSMVYPGEWIFPTQADSNGVLGGYWATMLAYTVQGRVALAKDRWQVLALEPNIAALADSLAGISVAIDSLDFSDDGIACTIATTYDGGSPAADVILGVRYLDGDAIIATGATDAAGEWRFWTQAPVSPPESLVVWFAHPWISYENPETLVVQAADVDSTWDGASYVPDVAPDPSMREVRGSLVLPGGAGGSTTPRVGITVKGELVRGTAPYVPSITLSRYFFSTVTDSLGRWSLWVVPNADIEPAGTRYKFTIVDDPVIIKIDEVPDEVGPINFNDL